MTQNLSLREQSFTIWQAAVAAVDPFKLVRDTLQKRNDLVAGNGRILVVGGGKAGAAMAAGTEAALASQLDRVVGLVNVPEGLGAPLKKIRLHPARSAGSNHPTAAGVRGTTEMLELLAGARPEDVALCLLSGGGSALMPAPVEGVTLEDKQALTRLLHACGATIDQMNCVRKHLSRVKGGRLATAFKGRALSSLIVSDVVGDPLDVIASGPTAADPTTFADALAVIDLFQLRNRAPASVVAVLESGAAGGLDETPKTLPDTIRNIILGNNTLALAAATEKAKSLGWPVLNLGSYLEGETKEVAIAVAGIVRSIQRDGLPFRPPVCLLSGGETTVAMTTSGKGGRNQEFVLAVAAKLGPELLHNVAILSAGTDGEDGPTDAAGAIIDASTFAQTSQLGLDPNIFLRDHNAYPLFDSIGGLLRTGLTGTNVMDVRVVLIGDS